MPKFVGNIIKGARPLSECPDDAYPLCRLTYAQCRLLRPEDVFYDLDTSDRGGPGRVAKRWYNWYAPVVVVLENSRSTTSMKDRAAAAAGSFLGVDKT
jgi:hypothetical protein